MPSFVSNSVVASAHVADTTGPAADQAFFIATRSAKIVDVRAIAGTAPAGADEIYDIHKNGTTIFTDQDNRPTIAAAATVSTTVAPDVVDLVEGDILTLDIDQVGTTEALNVLVQAEIV